MKITKIHSQVGNIIQQHDCEAIVNSAHPSMLAGSGVCGVIHKAAGKELEIYGKQFAPLKLTQAVLTPAFNLPNQYIIHVSAPRFYSDSEPLINLSKALRNTFELAVSNNIKTIALPAIATGIYGFNFNDAVKIYAEVAESFLNSDELEEIRFVFTTEEQVKLMQHQLLLRY
ncbi:MAG: RNase III inhibitor [Methylotenera sp.]|uniref:macro domain-containing protein n=1 Tax=Methylotenera sp. TaxID=2051956 RepID=UPI000D41F995|nr:macro domain-containing protein [Methylotenera sp.]PPC83983.1 MAG: RNase III inhibitor [Methylotenera sp.]